jgi:hypothetical protein
MQNKFGKLYQSVLTFTDNEAVDLSLSKEDVIVKLETANTDLEKKIGELQSIVEQTMNKLGMKI